MTAAVDTIINDVLRREGGYVNDPADRGGETNWGITEAAARAYGYVGQMRDMPLEVARSIYTARYVSTPGFHRLIEIDTDIAAEVIDTGVNMGPATAATFLQRWLNGFNAERRYSDLFVDGRCGPLTAGALHRFLEWRGEAGKRVLLAGLNGVQASRYLDITERDATQRRFLFGWIAHRVA